MRYYKVQKTYGVRGHGNITQEDRERIIEICKDQMHLNDVEFGNLERAKMEYLEWAYARGAEESYLKIIAAWPSNRQRKIIHAAKDNVGVDNIAAAAGVSVSYANATLLQAIRLGIPVNFDPEKEKARRASKRREYRERLNREIEAETAKPVDLRRLRVVEPEVHAEQRRSSNALAAGGSIKTVMREAPDGKIDLTVRVDPAEIGIIVAALQAYRGRT